MQMKRKKERKGEEKGWEWWTILYTPPSIPNGSARTTKALCGSVQIPGLCGICGF
jgi:hypothetical protein